MLVAFDFDGTLSDDEMVNLLGERAGCAEEIADITRRAMEGDLRYAESLRERVALLEGLSDADVEAAYDGVRLRPGAAAVIRDLNDAGVTTAIFTGGFEDGVARALSAAGVAVDRIVANRLLRSDDGSLAGTVEGPLVEGTKDAALASLADELGLSPTDAVAVGDGANDVPMLDAAGTAIGFRPKPAVEAHCDVVVESVAELRAALADCGLV